jgi:dihydroorotate dehydrogenase electron transfer subunit
MVETLLTVLKNEKLCEDVFKMTLKAEEFAEIQCGQFINVQIPRRGDLILRRPFALTDFDKNKKTISFCYKIVGEGTKELSVVKEGTAFMGTFPLGKGFILNESHKTVILLGGGAGIFPLLCVNKCYPEKKYHTMLGFKTKSGVILKEEFEKFSKETLICTEDGTEGASGFVTDSLKRNIDRIKPDIILSCGPVPMLKALKAAMKNYPLIPVLVSLEERMGCGIGACLVCACRINENGVIKHKRVCKDGPVFFLDEVEL